ncbi:DUF5305 domain-containing protein [Haloarchaeobius sp. DT45]|uniref:DUF5305 domain-containing protein n=1 Tax=Haloarchaeobius sp. DT45 TaxID=3446116 RepID=UPI003F6A74EE
MPREFPRLRAVLESQYVTVVAVLVLLALLGGWLTYGAYATQETTTEQLTEQSWAITGSFNHAATVTEENSLYPTGTELTNRSVYFGRVAPDFEGKYRFTYDARKSGTLSGAVDLVLVLRGVQGDQNEQQTVLWQTKEQLGNTSFDSLQPGQSVEIPFAFNATGAKAEADNLSEQLGASGETRVHVRAVVTAEGTVNGEQLQKKQTHLLPLSFEETTYEVPSPATETTAFNETRTVTVEEEPSGVGTTLGPFLAGTSLIGLVGVGAAKRTGHIELSETERQRLDYRDDRNEFDEWISTIDLPRDAFERPEAEAESLQALVDFAIDTDNAVLEAPDEEAYYVVHGDYLYSYRPPAEESTVSGDAEEWDTDNTDGEEE